MYNTENVSKDFTGINYIVIVEKRPNSITNRFESENPETISADLFGTIKLQVNEDLKAGDIIELQFSAKWKQKTKNGCARATGYIFSNFLRPDMTEKTIRTYIATGGSFKLTFDNKPFDNKPYKDCLKYTKMQLIDNDDVYFI